GAHPAIDAAATAEELGAGLGIGARFNGAVPALLRGKADCGMPSVFDGADHLLPSAAGKVSRKEAPVADDDSESHVGLSCGLRYCNPSRMVRPCVFAPDASAYI